jgi:hypothetical protein
MSPWVPKLAPHAVVLAAVLYWIWPNLVDGSPKAETKPAATSSEFTAATLTPTFPQPPKRNPFGGLLTDSIARAQSGATATKAADGNHANTADKKANSGKAEGHVLNATCIVGNQRLAMIDGRLYAVQESLPPGSAAGASYKIVKVLPYKVLLEREGKTLELTYSDAASQSAASSTSVGRAKPAAGASKATKSGGGPKGKSGGGKKSSTTKT